MLNELRLWFQAPSTYFSVVLPLIICMVAIYQEIKSEIKINKIWYLFALISFVLICYFQLAEYVFIKDHGEYILEEFGIRNLALFNALIILFSKNKKYNISLGMTFTLSFFVGFLPDLFSTLSPSFVGFIYLNFPDKPSHIYFRHLDHHLDNLLPMHLHAVGGMGLLDALFLMPLFNVILVFVIKKLQKELISKNQENDNLN
jgi:hypothetical protein